MDKTFFQVQENTNVTEPLVNISVPEGQQVALGSSSTPSAFQIRGNQLFLSVAPDYEVQAGARVGCAAPGGGRALPRLTFRPSPWLGLVHWGRSCLVPLP